jgi:hypothetical protein
VSETNETKRFDGETLGFLMQEKNRLTALRPKILDLADADTLDELDATIEEVGKAINLICLAHSARQQAREKYAKWRALQPQCRRAIDEYEALGIQVERAGFKLGEMRSRVEDAFNKLLQTRDSKPTPERFPTDAEISAYNAREQKAAAKHAEAVAKLTGALEEHQRSYRQQWQSKIALDQLLFTERQLKPHQDAEPAKLLSGVR